MLIYVYCVYLDFDRTMASLPHMIIILDSEDDSFLVDETSSRDDTDSYFADSEPEEDDTGS